MNQYNPEYEWYWCSPYCVIVVPSKDNTSIKAPPNQDLPPQEVFMIEKMKNTLHQSLFKAQAQREYQKERDRPPHGPEILRASNLFHRAKKMAKKSLPQML